VCIYIDIHVVYIHGVYIHGVYIEIHGVYIHGVSMHINGVSVYINGVSVYINGASMHINGVSLRIKGVSVYIKRCISAYKMVFLCIYADADKVDRKTTRLQGIIFSIAGHYKESEANSGDFGKQKPVE
jgi:hypothetical protein